jgi:hypothetical protein
MLRKLLTVLTLLSLMLASVPTSWLHWDEPEPLIHEEIACADDCNHYEGHLQSEAHTCLLIQLYVDFSEIMTHFAMRTPLPKVLPYLNPLISHKVVPLLLCDLSRGPPQNIVHNYLI